MIHPHNIDRIFGASADHFSTNTVDMSELKVYVDNEITFDRLQDCNSENGLCIVHQLTILCSNNECKIITVFTNFNMEKPVVRFMYDKVDEYWDNDVCEIEAYIEEVCQYVSDDATRSEIEYFINFFG